jgi:transposase InsO family protein
MTSRSDCVIQYACSEFRRQLKTDSMSKKGKGLDNAVAASFLRSLKKECIYRNNYQTEDEAKVCVFQ